MASAFKKVLQKQVDKENNENDTIVDDQTDKKQEI
jgi:hypothetical protein